MKNTIKIGFIASAAVLLIGCSTTNSIPYKASTSNVINQPDTLKQNSTPLDTAHELHICRTKSFIPNIETPDLFINGKNMFEISNGRRLKAALNKNDTFSIETTANPLLYRMKSEVIYSGIMSENSQFIVINAERNVGLGLSVFFGGAIGAALRDGANSGPSGSWSYTIVEQKSFEQECAK